MSVGDDFVIALPQVTLFGVVWSKDPGVLDRTRRVLRYCQSFIRFGQVKLFEPEGISDLMGFNRWLVHEAPKLIKSAYAMHIHDDGFPIDPSLWTPKFLMWDYIGAPWGDGVVGNEGFSIESRKLMQLKLRLPTCNEPSDNYICRHWRKWLELKGVRFAPTELALKFSTEGQLGENLQSFGFHGRHASPRKFLQGWDRITAFERTL